MVGPLAEPVGNGAGRDVGNDLARARPSRPRSAAVGDAGAEVCVAVITTTGAIAPWPTANNAGGDEGGRGRSSGG